MCNTRPRQASKSTLCSRLALVALVAAAAAACVCRAGERIRLAWPLMAPSIIGPREARSAIQSDPIRSDPIQSYSIRSYSIRSDPIRSECDTNPVNRRQLHTHRSHLVALNCTRLRWPTVRRVALQFAGISRPFNWRVLGPNVELAMTFSQALALASHVHKAWLVSAVC